MFDYIQFEKCKKFFSDTPVLAVLYGILVCVFFLNIGNELYSIFYRALAVDEFQHIHIAWNMFHFKEVIYRDFWEHHGVIYATINYIWFFIFNLGTNFSTFYVIRFISFLYSLVLLFFIYKIAYLLFKSRFIAFTSITVLSSLFFFQMKAIEIRPDILQNTFWIAGIYIVLLNIRTVRGSWFYFAGILFGLAIGTNTKAGFGVALVLLFFLIEFFLRNEKRDNVLKIIKIGSGIMTVHLCIFSYFLFQGAVREYLLNSFYSNFILLSHVPLVHILSNLMMGLIPTTVLLLLFSALGIFFIFRENSKKNDERKELFLLIAVGSTSSVFIGPWENYYVVFLPFLAVACAYFMEKILQALPVRGELAMVIAPFILGVLLLSFKIPSQNSYDAMLLSFPLQSQEYNTDYILKKINNEEAVGFFWNNCGGFVFNRDVQYYWIFDTVFGNTYLSLTGIDQYGSQYVEALQEKKVVYIIAMQDEVKSLFSQDTQDFILKNYTRINDCILEKNNITQEF